MITFAPDVSFYDAYTLAGTYRPMNWLVCKSIDKISIAIMKCSEYAIDPALDVQRKAAKGILPRMFYHYFRPGNTNQWNILEASIGDDFQDNDLIALDWESYNVLMTPKAQRDYAYSLLCAIRSHFDTTPYIYTYPGFWNGLIGGKNDPRFTEFKLWEALWPYDVKPWITSDHPVFTSLDMVNFKARILAGTLSVKSVGGSNPSKYILSPWNREPDMWQFTSRCSPAYIKGYTPNASKKAVDFNAIYVDVSF